MKKILIPALTLSLIAGGLYAGSKVAALGLGAGNSDMAESLASKLGTSTDAVQSAFESMREEHREEMETAYEERLTEAVSAGDLTEEQKQLILQKHEELQAQHEARIQARQQERAELEQWAADNGIDAQYLFGGLGGMKGGRMGGRGMHGEW
jgi:uncharacterized glyoxalase superfamily metalloenzyme YdcJ